MYVRLIRLYAILILIIVVFSQDRSIIIQDTSCIYAIVGIPAMLDKNYLGFDFEDFDDSLSSVHGVINVGDYVRIYYDLNYDGIEDRVCFHRLNSMYRSNDTLYHFPEKEYEFLYVDEDFDFNWDWLYWMKGPYGEVYQVPIDRYEEWLDSLVNDLRLDKI